MHTDLAVYAYIYIYIYIAESLGGTWCHLRPAESCRDLKGFFTENILRMIQFSSARFPKVSVSKGGMQQVPSIHPSCLPSFLPSVPPLYVHCITLGSVSCIPTAMQNQSNAQLTATSATSSSCPLGRLSETLTTRRQAQDGNRRVERPQRTSTRMHH